MRELEDEANRTGIPINNLAKQILTNYARWDKFVSKAGMIPVAKGVISEAFEIHTCIMQHNLGLKWSLYHKIVLQLILKEILGQSAITQINIDENIVVLKFKEYKDGSVNLR